MTGEERARMIDDLVRNGLIPEADRHFWSADSSELLIKHLYTTAANAVRPTEKVDHPKHYNSHPSGIECITVIESMPFNIGSAIKYLWRAGLKDSAPTDEDYAKAIWYIERERQRLKSMLEPHA